MVARFTNGATHKIYKVPLATFANPLALDPPTGNVYSQTDASGAFNLRDAGSGGAGALAGARATAASNAPIHRSGRGRCSGSALRLRTASLRTAPLRWWCLPSYCGPPGPCSARRTIGSRVA